MERCTEYWELLSVNLIFFNLTSLLLELGTCISLIMRGGSQLKCIHFSFSIFHEHGSSLCFVIVDSVTGNGYNNEYNLPLAWVSVCRRRKDHSYAPLCKHYSNIHRRYHRSTLSCWLSRRQLLDDLPLTIPDNEYCNYRFDNNNLWTFVCLLWMRTIPQVYSNHSWLLLTGNFYISWGHLSPCNVCTPAYPYLKEIQRKQRRAG